MLKQLDDDGQHHPIAYATSQTKAAEKKYMPTELEVAALQKIIFCFSFL